MEATQTNVQGDAPKQKPRQRISKLTAADLAAFPGANPPPIKVKEPAFTYSLWFKGAVITSFGTLAESAQLYDFAHQLDTQAKAKTIGEVTSVGIADGYFEIVLMLGVVGEQVNPGAPAANAFSQLKDFLGNAALLKQGAAGKPVTYKAKVNGTTIVEGVF